MVETVDREPVPWARRGGVGLGEQTPALLRRRGRSEARLAAGAQRHHDSVDADVVAQHAVLQFAEVELLRFGHASARDLLVEVDLRGRTELVLEEPLETQQLLVSSSTAQVDLEEREVAVRRHEFDAGRRACGEQQQSESTS